MMLFEYAIIHDEDRDENDKVTRKAEVVKRGDLLARDELQARILVSREIPEELVEDLESVTLAVRPF